MTGYIIILILCVIMFIAVSYIPGSKGQPGVSKPSAPVPSTPSSSFAATPKRKTNGLITHAERSKRILAAKATGVYKGKLKWFVVERALEQISVAEQLIVKELNKYHVKWHREVAFEEFKLTDYSYARYDFLIEVPGGIILCEYDSVEWHSTPEQLKRDKLKTAFCRKHGIPLVRYCKQHYYRLGEEIGSLMGQYGIAKKQARS